MNKIELITDLNSEKVEIYKENKERQLATYFEPAEGIFIAESAKIIERALDAGYEPISVLCEVKETQSNKDMKQCVPRQSTPIERIQNVFPNVPVYGAEFEVLKNLVGYHLTGGILCAMRRKKLEEPEQFLQRIDQLPGKDGNEESLDNSRRFFDVAIQRRIVIFDNVENPRNVGTLFRSAAALGMDGVLLTGDCADPLYRRAARVSMGSVFQIPWTKVGKGWPQEFANTLHAYGYTIVGMALTDDSIGIEDPILKQSGKIAIIMGNEGDGLSDETMSCLDHTVKIPMYHGVDSLNVAAAGAVAFYALTK